MSFETFRDSYIETLLWSEVDCDEDGSMGENFEGCDDELAPEALKDIETDCRDFYDAHCTLFEGDESQAGHDFCLTRNGHGAGFWDGDWPDDIGAELTEASKPYGTQGLCRGDDGLIYTHG